MRRAVEQLVEKIFAMRAVDPLGLGVGIGNAYELQEAVAERIVVAALARAGFPVAVAYLLRRLQAIITEMAEAMIVIDHIFRGARNARAGYPDRRMRLLNRSRPQVHHAELVVL